MMSETESSEDLQLKVTDLKNQLEQREEALKQAHISMDTLTAELEELDRQNQEATQVCLVLHWGSALCGVGCSVTSQHHL